MMKLNSALLIDLFLTVSPAAAEPKFGDQHSLAARLKAS